MGRDEPVCLYLFISLYADGFAEKYLNKLFGGNDVEDALRRIDKLTPEETRMAGAETMTVTRDIDDAVKSVVKTLDGVEGQVKGIDHRVKGVNHVMKDVGHVVKGVNHRVRGVDCRVKVVDHKLGSVLTGESLHGSRIRAQRFTRLGVMETGLAIQQVSNRVNDLNRSCYSNIITADHERSISQYRK